MKILGQDIAERVKNASLIIYKECAAYALTPLTLDRDSVREQLGDSVVGLAGQETAIGDAINVAARIEGLSKEAGYRLICSRAAVERLSHVAALVALGPMAIKGHTPVEVFGYDKVSLPPLAGKGRAGA